MTSEDLRGAFRDLVDLPFPPHSSNPQIEDLLWDVLAADGYYAGIATSAIGRTPSKFEPVSGELEELRDRVQSLRTEYPAERRAIDEIDAYLAAMIRVRDALP